MKSGLRPVSCGVGFGSGSDVSGSVSGFNFRSGESDIINITLRESTESFKSQVSCWRHPLIETGQRLRLR